MLTKSERVAGFILSCVGIYYLNLCVKEQIIDNATKHCVICCICAVEHLRYYYYCFVVYVVYVIFIMQPSLCNIVDCCYSVWCGGPSYVLHLYTEPYCRITSCTYIYVVVDVNNNWRLYSLIT